MKPETIAMLKSNDIPEEDWPYLQKGMAEKDAKARRWIQANLSEIERFRAESIHNAATCYEHWSAVYGTIRPGDEHCRGFMFAWCDEFGGI